VTETKGHAIVFDSSCWIEVLNGGPLSAECESELRRASRVIVPSTVFYEVYKKLSLMVSEDRGLSGVALLSQHEMVDLTRDLVLSAADLSIAHQLAMADSVVLAHAIQENATLVTLDNDFMKVPGAKVIR
jgi:predicted nucleic acid-binding protein